MSFGIKPVFIKPPPKDAKSKRKAPKSYMKRGVLITPQTYPENWDTIKKAVDKRDRSSCFFCRRTKKQLEKMGRWLERHHLQSVRSGNNRKINIVSACNHCHAKQYKHGHLKGRTK